MRTNIARQCTARTRRTHRAAAGMAVLLLTGCGSSGGHSGNAAVKTDATSATVVVSTAVPDTTRSASSDTATTTSATSSTASSATTAPTPDTTVPSSTTAPATSGQPTVKIMDFAFNAPTITIHVGDTVTWTNGDPYVHSVVEPNGEFRSDPLKTNSEFTHTFTKAGKFTYFCGIHSYMTGEIDVTG